MFGQFWFVLSLLIFARTKPIESADRRSGRESTGPVTIEHCIGAEVAHLPPLLGRDSVARLSSGVLWRGPAPSPTLECRNCLQNGPWYGFVMADNEVLNSEPAPEWLVAEGRSRVLAAEDASPELLKRVIEGADQLEAKRSVSQ